MRGEKGKTVSAGRERLSFDQGWSFHLGEIPLPVPVTHEESYLHGFAKTGGFQGPAGKSYDDSSWRLLDLPHDWAVEGAFSPSANMNHGYLPTGQAWYRKSFELPASDEGRRIFLEFDGVFRDATVYLNGHRIGNEPSGYISVRYDITDQALYGEMNSLAVHVDASVNEGWWYEGAGIYRHVWLLKTPALHIKPWGVFVRSEVKASNGKAKGPATLTIETDLANDSDANSECEVESSVIDASGKELISAKAKISIDAGDSATAKQQMKLESPELWSVESPALYTLRSRLLRNGKPIDSTETVFGIRSAVFDPDKGFLLNGKPVKLKGTSNHQDHAGVGVAVPDSLNEFRIKRLQEMGSNAWRCAHNPPAPEFLDACDRLGMLVMDETRCMNSTVEGMRQLESMLLRDRNHPSVIVWSVGNEEHFHQGTESGRRIVSTMKRLVRKLDLMRPISIAMHHSWGGPVTPVLDVQGINYSPGSYDGFHKEFPKHPVLATETSPAFCTRGVYEDDPERCHLRSYDVRKTPKEWGHCITVEEAWKAVAERPFVAGLFPWTGFDYRGEPAPHKWPCVVTNMGILDLCGFPKDHFFYHQSWWSEKPVLHLLPHWNWPGHEGQEKDVWCYSNCDKVELFLNGVSLGAKEMPRNGHLEWKVKYAPGVLSAKGFDSGKLVMTAKVETTGAPAQIAISADRRTLDADGNDVAVLTVSILDAEGRLVPYAGNDVAFKVSGPGTIIGTGNGDPSSHEADKAPRRKTFSGLCQLIVQTQRGKPGEIVLEALSTGLKPAMMKLKSITNK